MYYVLSFQSFDRTVDELKTFIDARNKAVCLQDLSGIAEINFLEVFFVVFFFVLNWPCCLQGFDAFISYIHTGNEPVEEDVEPEEETVEVQYEAPLEGYAAETNTQSQHSSIR